MVMMIMMIMALRTITKTTPNMVMMMMMMMYIHTHMCLRVTHAFIYALQSTYRICKHYVTLCITKRREDTAGV